MSLLVALVLGLVQGLTEFFPISSSAHLILVKELFNVSKIPVIFDLACHGGTLFALIWFFKDEVLRLFKKDRKKIIYLGVALLPLFPSYYLLKPLREVLSRPEFLGLFMMLTGGVLLTGQKVRVKKKKGVMRDALLIGAMQSAALIPGISRSASTISCAQVLGWNSKDAVRFSFLLAIPTIIGGNIVESQKLWKAGQLRDLLNIECLVAFGTSLIVGMLVIRFAINWLEKGNLKILAWYCLIIGSIVNVYLYSR